MGRLQVFNTKKAVHLRSITKCHRLQRKQSLPTNMNAVCAHLFVSSALCLKHISKLSPSQNSEMTWFYWHSTYFFSRRQCINTERLEDHFYKHMPRCRMVVARFQRVSTFACLLSLVSTEEVLQLWREFVNATQPCHAQRNAAIPFLPPTASRLKETHF